MRLLRLGIRNLARNRRRSIVTGLAIAFGATALVFLQGFVNGFTRAMIEGSVLVQVGTIQIHRKGYLGSEEPLQHAMKADDALVARIEAIPGVGGVAPRLKFDGMMSNGSEATMFVATAIDPDREYRVCPRRRTRVAPGSRPLEDGAGNDALIGRTLVSSLGAKMGSTLVMQSSGPSGATNALDVQVSGFLPLFNINESKRVATVPLRLAQRLLRMEGQITGYVVGVPDLEQVDAVAEKVRAIAGEDFQVTTWKQVDVDIKDGVAQMKFLLGFVAVILFFLVGTGIVNTMMMAVHERVREIGTMLAVGVRRRQVTRIFLWEALCLGLLGALAGSGVGYAIVRAIARKGVPMHPPGEDVTNSMLIYPSVGADYLALVTLFAVAGTILAALYPAWKASRMKPVDALRAL